MQIKREDCKLIRTFEDEIGFILKPDFFDDKPELLVEDDIASEVIEEKEPEPTPEELEAIAKAEKKAELLAQLAELEE